MSESATESRRLSTRQVARFVARGFLRFDGLVDETLNREFIEEFEAGPPPPPPAGTPLSQAYAEGSAQHRLLQVPEVRGVIQSLLGSDPLFDHHFYHVTHGSDSRSQYLHQDSTIDTRTAFDLQLFYFPHAVRADMGGTRLVPGSHLRVVHESSIARYQNVLGQERIICPAGTLLACHHGLWHGGGRNASGRRRIMFKVRLNPAEPQVRLWDVSDLEAENLGPKPLFVPDDGEDVQSILCQGQPWFEDDTRRLEFMNRVRLWRYLLGDERADAHYWMTRVENVPR